MVEKAAVKGPSLELRVKQLEADVKHLVQILHQQMGGHFSDKHLELMSREG